MTAALAPMPGSGAAGSGVRYPVSATTSRVETVAEDAFMSYQREQKKPAPCSGGQENGLCGLTDMARGSGPRCASLFG